MPLEKLTGVLCATHTSKLETCGLWQLVVVACRVRMGTKMTSLRSTLCEKKFRFLVRCRTNVAKGLKVQGMLLANGLLCEAKTNAQQQQLKTKLADMIPDSLAFVVLFQGVEKGLKVQLDPTCHEKGTSKTKLF